MFRVALKAATTTCGGFSFGEILASMPDRAPAAWRGARNAKPPAERPSQRDGKALSCSRSDVVARTLCETGKDLKRLQIYVLLH